MSQIRHTFVVTVFEDGRVAVVEDLHSGAALPRGASGASRPGQ